MVVSESHRGTADEAEVNDHDAPIRWVSAFTCRCSVAVGLVVTKVPWVCCRFWRILFRRVGWSEAFD